MSATYVKLESYTLATTSSSVTFNTFGAGYTDLVLICSARFGSASGSKIRFNGDSGSNYSMTYMIAHTGGASSDNQVNTTSIYNNITYGDATATDVFTPYVINIQSYANTNVNKTLLWRGGTGGTLQGSNSETQSMAGLWRNTNAITSIEISPFNATTYTAGCVFTLYGIKAK